MPDNSASGPAFYSPKSVLKLEKWIDRAIVIGIISVTLYDIGQFGTLHTLVYDYFFSLGQSSPIVIGLAVVLMLCAIAFSWVIIYFPMKALLKILQILMQMEMNSRKTK
jgi:hypothetical protein